MNRHIRAVSIYFSIAVLSTVVFSISPEISQAAVSIRNGRSGNPAVSKAGARALQTYWRLPLYFIANRGQVNKEAVFYETGPGHATFFTRKGLVLSLSSGDRKVDRIRNEPAMRRALLGKSPAGNTPGLRSSYLRIGMPGMNKEMHIAPEDEQPGKVGCFLGKDRAKWRANIPTYGAVLYKDAYPGIDLKFYGDNRRLEYDIIAGPGADLSKVAFEFSGAKDVHVTAAGDLAIELKVGRLVMKKPLVYQRLDGRRVLRQGRFEVRRDNSGQKHPTFTCGFEVGAYDPSIPLVIDPVLFYSTFLGGSGNDAACAIAVDGAGNAYIAGLTGSTDFPESNSLQSSNKGGDYDAFVTELAAGGQGLVYSTYLGGSGDDTAFGIAVDGSGEAYVTGTTTSIDFTTTSNAFQPNYSGSTSYGDCFVAKIAAGGQGLVYSTYLSGTGGDAGCSIAVDSSGDAYVAGTTLSTDFPLKNAYQSVNGGGWDGFVAEIDPSGQGLVYSTYFGGKGDDAAYGIAVDSFGDAYVTGDTLSSNFPIKNALQSSYGGGAKFGDAFVAEVSAGGQSLVYSTYLGGSGDDVAYSIAVDTSGDAYVAGLTQSTDFPHSSALYASLKGAEDAFVAEISPGGQGLVYSTYLGGTGGDWATGIAVDSSGNAYVTGDTLSGDFPLSNNASQATYAGGSTYGDAFLTEIAPGGKALLLSTYLGGSKDESAYGIAVDTWGDAYVTGSTESGDFPLNNAFQSAFGAGQEHAFIAEFAGLWRDATPTGNGWMWLNWLQFATGDSPWIYTLKLGWLYPVGISTDSIWFYDPQWDRGQGGWWWTSSSFFPWIYSVTENQMLYFDEKDSTPGSRWFFTSGGQATTH